MEIFGFNARSSARDLFENAHKVQSEAEAMIAIAKRLRKLSDEFEDGSQKEEVRRAAHEMLNRLEGILSASNELVKNRKSDR